MQMFTSLQNSTSQTNAIKVPKAQGNQSASLAGKYQVCISCAVFFRANTPDYCARAMGVLARSHKPKCMPRVNVTICKEGICGLEDRGVADHQTLNSHACWVGSNRARPALDSECKHLNLLATIVGIGGIHIGNTRQR